jgi:DNA-directed RNA polymerase specialized sigma24 family protein
MKSVHPSARRWLLASPLCAVLLAAAAPADAQTQFGPQTLVLLDRLCAQTLRTNEEDRLYGMISNAVRATIRYRDGPFTPDMIDDAVQDSLDAMIDECPEFADVEEAKRVDMAIEIIADATTKALADHQEAEKDPALRHQQIDKVTAADLSQELSSQEIDQWLDSLPPRERALTLFLYASDVTPDQVAAAVGEPLGALNRRLAASKGDLLRIFREEWNVMDAPRAGPAIEYRETGQSFAALLPPAVSHAPQAPTPPQPESIDPPARSRVLDGAVSGLRVTGISDDLYAGWSLLATARNLPRGERIEIGEPFLLEPDTAGLKRMLVVGIAEIGNPYDEIRRFLLKAYAVDAENDAAGLGDSFHLGATKIDNPEARKTLGNPNLSSIEVARCLWHDFGTGPDPGLCR